MVAKKDGPEPCKTCGTCPTCGRGPQQVVYPPIFVRPWPLPMTGPYWYSNTSTSVFPSNQLKVVS